MTTTDPIRAALLTLTPAQQTAAETLATGGTHAEAAEAAAVARETVTRWAGHHPAFRAALALYRSTLATEQADRARRIRAKALDAVEAGLKSGSIDPLAVLRTVQAASELPPPAATAAELLDAATRRTMVNLPPLAPPRRLEDQLEQLNNPPPSDIERATAATLARLADANELNPGPGC